MNKNLYTFKVNNILYTIYPGSFEYNMGYSTIKTEAGSVGGGVTEPVFEEDVTDALGKVKVKMYNTDATKAAIALWRKTNGANVVSGISKTGAPVLLQFAAMVNNPDYKNDGIDVEFVGAQMSSPV